MGFIEILITHKFNRAHLNYKIIIIYFSASILSIRVAHNIIANIIGFEIEISKCKSSLGTRIIEASKIEFSDHQNSVGNLKRRTCNSALTLDP